MIFIAIGKTLILYKLWFTFYEEQYPIFHLLPWFNQFNMRPRKYTPWVLQSGNNNAIVPMLAYYTAEKYRHEFDDEHNVILWCPWCILKVTASDPQPFRCLPFPGSMLEFQGEKYEPFLLTLSTIHHATAFIYIK